MLAPRREGFKGNYHSLPTPKKRVTKKIDPGSLLKCSRKTDDGHNLKQRDLTRYKKNIKSL